MPRVLDLTGVRFGRLVAIRQDGFVMAGREKKRAWLCQCDCGCTKQLPTGALRSGNTTSCGCLHKEQLAARSYRHGASHGRDGSRTYSAWCAMKSRCNNPANIGYANYGGRGIRVHPEWDASYKAFERDMGKCPHGHSIERLDADKGYEPGNCEWQPRSQQNVNKRNSVWIDLDGERMNLVEACRRAGIHYSYVSALSGKRQIPHQAAFDHLLARKRNVPAIPTAA